MTDSEKCAAAVAMEDRPRGTLMVNEGGVSGEAKTREQFLSLSARGFVVYPPAGLVRRHGMANP